MPDGRLKGEVVSCCMTILLVLWRAEASSASRAFDAQRSKRLRGAFRGSILILKRTCWAFLDDLAGGAIPVVVGGVGHHADNKDVTLAALQAGDAKAREAWVHAELPRMRAVARRLLRDESAADDAVQEAFVNAFRSLPAFRGEASLSTWLHRIVVNVALGRLRKAATSPTDAAEELLADAPLGQMSGGSLSPRWGEVERLAARDETRALTRRMIDRLPENHRTVLILRDIEELSTAESAEALSVSAGVIKTRLHRARLALKTIIESEIGVHAAEELA